MKASDIVRQLVVLLPQLTDKFTDSIPLRSLAQTPASTLITAVCDAKHDVEPGDAVSIVGSTEYVPIASFTRVGEIGTIVTSSNHDLTERIAPTVTVSGMDESEFNGTFTRLNISNRKTITVVMTDAGPASASGGVLEQSESRLRYYNGTYAVVDVLDDFRFTFNHPLSGLQQSAQGELIARVKPRITAGIRIDRLADAYTKQGDNQYWMFVVLEDTVASKSRHIHSDAVDNQPRGAEYRQEIVQPFTVYVFIPVTGEIAGRFSRDIAEDLFRPICRSLLFSKFDSGLYAGSQNPVQFIEHGVHEYNSSLYIHAFSFQQVADIVFEDTVGADLDVAMRDMAITFDPDLGGTSVLNANIDLDEDPLP